MHLYWWLSDAAEAESYVDVDLGIYLGTSAGDDTYASVGDQSDGTYNTTFVASGVELHITLVCLSTTSGHAVRVKTLQLREVGVASGWT